VELESFAGAERILDDVDTELRRRIMEHS
jgi:hypothetical protein